MRSVVSVLLVSSILALGCGKGGGGGGAPAANIPPEASALFSQRCTPCHGPSGGGDGPASASLNPRPRNFHDAAWQRSVTDEHLEKIIIGGGASVGKSPAMPANPDLQGRAAIVAGLRAKIRSLAD